MEQKNNPTVPHGEHFESGDNGKIERRFLNLTLRASNDPQKPAISGTAAVFDEEAVIGDWFREKIRAGEFTRVLSESPDVIGAFNHNWDKVLGRTTAGTLQLEQTDKGLLYFIDINPNDPEAMSVYAKVQRGDVHQSSFAFTVRKEEWEKPADRNELPMREIVEVGELLDVSPVTFPAYPQTSVSARSMVNELLSELQRQTSQAASGDAEGAIGARQAARNRRLRISVVETPISGK